MKIGGITVLYNCTKVPHFLTPWYAPDTILETLPICNPCSNSTEKKHPLSFTAEVSERIRKGKKPSQGHTADKPKNKS